GCCQSHAHGGRSAPAGRCHRRTEGHHRPAIQRPPDPARRRQGRPADARHRRTDDRDRARHHAPHRPARDQEARLARALPDGPPSGLLPHHQVRSHPSRQTRRTQPRGPRFGPRASEKTRAREPHRSSRQDPRAWQPAVHRKETFPMKFRTLAVAAFLVTASSLFAETFAVDKVHSEATFQVRHMMSKVSGKFDDFTGKINVDRANLSASSVEFTMKTASINTSNADRDKDLRSANFFDADKNPEITFKSTKIVASKKKDVY